MFQRAAPQMTPLWLISLALYMRVFKTQFKEKFIIEQEPQKNYELVLSNGVSRHPTFCVQFSHC